MLQVDISTAHIGPIYVSVGGDSVNSWRPEPVGGRFEALSEARWRASSTEHERRPPVQQTIRIPDDVRGQLRLLATITGIDEEEHLRRAMRGYLETSGRDAEVRAFTDRARERYRRVLDRLGEL